MNDIPPISDAEYYFDLAYEFRDAEQHGQALRVCNIALATARSFLANIYNLRAIILEEMAHNDEAIEAYLEALRIDPGCNAATQNLADLEAELGIQHRLLTIAAFDQPATAHIYKGRLEAEGVPAFLADEEIVTANWFYSNAIGGVKLQVQEADAARAAKILGLASSILIEAAEETPDDAWICPRCESVNVHYEKYRTRGVFLSMLLAGFPFPFLKRRWKCNDCGHEWSQADAEHPGAQDERAKADPDNALAFRQLADACANQGRWEDAERAYRKAIALTPADGDLYNNLGTALEKLDREIDAEAAYRQASALNPRDSLPYYNLGLLYDGQGRVAEAIRAFEKCLRYSVDVEECDEVRQYLDRLEEDVKRKT